MADGRRENAVSPDGVVTQQSATILGMALSTMITKGKQFWRGEEQVTFSEVVSAGRDVWDAHRARTAPPKAHRDELDATPKPCRVTLMSKPLDAAPVLTAAASQIAHHWALRLEFPDKVVYHELSADHDGAPIHPDWWYEHEKPEIVATYIKKDPIGTITISPRDAVLRLRQHPFNGQPYRLGTRNCQEWAKIACDLLELKLEIASIRDTKHAHFVDVVAGLLASSAGNDQIN